MSPVIDNVVQDPHDNWIVSPGGEAVPGTIIGQVLDPASRAGKAAQRIYDLGLCYKCGKRQGIVWGGDALAMTHGGGALRCGVCVYGAKFYHALACVQALPKIAICFARALIDDRLHPFEPPDKPIFVGTIKASSYRAALADSKVQETLRRVRERYWR